MKRLINVFKLIVSPGSTWISIFQTSSHQMLERALFYPMIAIYAVSFFLRLVYDPTLDFSEVLTDAIIGFVAYFIGYLIVAQILNIVIPKLQEEGKSSSEGKIRTFVIYSMSILLMIDILQNLLPSNLILLTILQFYLVYVIDKAKTQFHLNEDKTLVFLVVSFALIFIAPILIRNFFDMFL